MIELNSTPPPLPPDSAATRYRPLLHLVALFVGLLPVVGAAWAAKTMVSVMGAMATSGAGGVGAVAAGLYEANNPLIVASVIAAVLAAATGGFALRMRAHTASLPGLTLAGLVAAGCLPAVLLWRAESFILDVVAGRVEAGVVEASSRLARLLMASLFLGPALVALLIAIFLITVLRTRKRSAGSAGALAAVWAANAVLLLALALSYYARASALRDAAMTGTL